MYIWIVKVRKIDTETWHNLKFMQKSMMERQIHTTLWRLMSIEPFATNFIEIGIKLNICTEWNTCTMRFSDHMIYQNFSVLNNSNRYHTSYHQNESQLNNLSYHLGVQIYVISITSQRYMALMSISNISHCCSRHWQWREMYEMFIT